MAAVTIASAIYEGWGEGSFEYGGIAKNAAKAQNRGKNIKIIIAKL